MRTISVSVHISAEPMTVWAVLTDLASYPDWNPLFPAAAGEVAVGRAITLQSVHPSSGRTMPVRATVLAAEPGIELRWTAGLKGIIGGEHAFTLSQDGSGTTLVQSETFGGVLVPFAGRTLMRAEASFRDLNEAIRMRAETR